MSVQEQQPQPQPQGIESAAGVDSARQTAWEVFRFYSGSQDGDRFQAAYLGSWPSRRAFGDHLLEDYGVERYLRGLPPWLQRYTRLDPEAFVADFERAGHYYLAEVSNVVHVFDPHV